MELALVRTERDTASTERDEALSDLGVTRDELNEREKQLAVVQTQLDSANTELTDVRAERDSVAAERDAALSDLSAANVALTELDSQLAKTQAELDKAAVDLNNARAQLAEVSIPLVLSGAMQERRFPTASFYHANGTLELEVGNWAFVAGDIGGQEATRAGDASVELLAIPSDCMQALSGDWPGAFVLDCPATVEWTVESRYPHFLLNILPLADSITVPEEVEATQDE